MKRTQKTFNDRYSEAEQPSVVVANFKAIVWLVVMYVALFG